MPHSSRKRSSTTTMPTITEKAPATKLKSNQKHGQKRGAGDLISGMVELELASNNEQAHPLAKKEQPSHTHSEQTEHATNPTVLCLVGTGSRGQTTKSTVAGAESKVNDIRSGVAKHQIVASSDIGTDTKGNPEMPCCPAKKVKT